MIGTAAQEDLEKAIASARNKLDQFENGAGTSELLARLRNASPMHPFLVMRVVGLLGGMVSVVGAVAVMTSSVLSRDVAVQINDLQTAIGVPLPLVFVILATCGFTMMVAGHLGAISSGRSAPYLPAEAKAHQRLMADVQQLEAQRAVKERMTPRPATPRLLDRRSAR